MSYKTNRKTRGKFRAELHPFVAHPSKFEPILTTSQKLTPAQKAHLDEFQDRDALLIHLASYHGQTFLGLRESQLAHPLDPQVRERFGIPDSPVVSDQTLRLRHLQEHLENIEERMRTAPRKKPLTAEEYREAGIEEAPGFEKE